MISRCDDIRLLIFFNIFTAQSNQIDSAILCQLILLNWFRSNSFRFDGSFCHSCERLKKQNRKNVNHVEIQSLQQKISGKTNQITSRKIFYGLYRLCSNLVKRKIHSDCFLLNWSAPLDFEEQISKNMCLHRYYGLNATCRSLQNEKFHPHSIFKKSLEVFFFFKLNEHEASDLLHSIR